MSDDITEIGWINLREYDIEGLDAIELRVTSGNDSARILRYPDLQPGRYRLVKEPLPEDTDDE